MNHVVERTVVLYDEDCGLCRWSVDRVLDWDRFGRVRVTPIQSEEGSRLLHEVADDGRLHSMHVVDRAGAVYSGGGAVAVLLHSLPFGSPLAWVAERAPRLTERLYRLVADNRTRLGNIVGADACDVDPQRPRR
ncbi:MAG: DUF393 domain-containing protein [Actinomycetota bacterium]